MRLRWDAMIAELPPSAGKRIGRSVWLHASALGPRLTADLAGVHAQPHDVPAEDLVLRIDHAERRVA